MITDTVKSAYICIKCESIGVKERWKRITIISNTKCTTTPYDSFITGWIVLVSSLQSSLQYHTTMNTWTALQLFYPTEMKRKMKKCYRALVEPQH